MIKKRQIFYGCIASIFFIVIISMVLTEKVVIIGDSMEPNFYNGEKIIMRKKFIFEDYSRFDIILFNSPLDKKEKYIKRIIALPNEMIYCENGIIFINGVALEETYVIKGVTENFGPYKLKEKEYFVLGDNRENSTDSRTFGILKIANILYRL